MEKKKVVVLGGGFSEEREISLITSAKVAEALQQRGLEVFRLDPADYGDWSQMIAELKRINADIVFIGLHGAEGEDGRIQSLLSLHKIIFTGSGYKASAIAMDKEISGLLAQQAGALLPDRIILTKNNNKDYQGIIDKLGFPIVVKPNSSGSSVGISIVHKVELIQEAIETAFKYSEKVICESFIAGRELTVTILGDEAMPVVEIKPNNGWYNYANKYTSGNTVYQVPAELDSNETKVIQQQALSIYQLIGCRGYARVDFRYDGEVFYFLEVNTLPGMTPLSLTPMAAKEAGLSFSELLLAIIEQSLS